MSNFYHEGSRQIQDRFGSVALADKLEAITVHSEFTTTDRDFIQQASMFFLATSDPAGFPDCSYKGGEPGFVKISETGELLFPSYDGNGQYRSVGNIQANPKVGLLFIDFQQQVRIRVNGTARLDYDLKEFLGAELTVVVTPEFIFPNCPRYIHKQVVEQRSEYSPKENHTPPEPQWKGMEIFSEVIDENQG